MSVYAPGDEFDTKGRAYSWSPVVPVQMECDGYLLYPQQLWKWWILEKTPEARAALGFPDLDSLPEIDVPWFTPFHMAYRFEQMLAAPFEASSDEATEQWISDDNTNSAFRFEFRAGYVRITAGIWERSMGADGTFSMSFVRNEASSQLVVKCEEFWTEVERFITEFIAELLEHVPEFKSWETLRPFERFR